MAAKLSLAKLIAQVENGELSAEAAKRYFLIDKSSRVAFSPALRFNPRTVDITGLESSAEVVATALARDIDLADARARAAERPRSFALKAYGAKDAVAAAELGATILAEGDSWFDLPPFIYPRTLIDFLGRTHRVVTLAKWGDTLEGMLAKKEFVEPLRTGAFKHFLFSGGGTISSAGAISRSSCGSSTSPIPTRATRPGTSTTSSSSHWTRSWASTGNC